MKYIVQSKDGELAVTVTYGPTGTFMGMVVNKEVSFEVLNKLLASVDYQEANLIKRYKPFPKLLTPVPEDTSFDKFWNAYGLKRNKKRSERLWKRLMEEERVKCLAYIPKYLIEVRQAGIGQKYPDTFLYNESWNDY